MSSRCACHGRALFVAQQRGWLDVGEQRVTPTELGKRFTNDVIALFLD